MRRTPQIIFTATPVPSRLFTVMSRDNTTPESDRPVIASGLVNQPNNDHLHSVAKTSKNGCLHEWTGLFGDQKATDLLEEMLDEEKAAQEGITYLALANGNDEGLYECCDSDKAEAPENTTDEKAAKSSVRIRPMPAGVR